MAKDTRVEIGFVGGGNTSFEVPEDQLQGFMSNLRDAQSANSWFTVTSGDGSQFIMDLSKVVFVRVAATSRTIGFAHA